jgi:hypothetical protein
MRRCDIQPHTLPTLIHKKSESGESPHRERIGSWKFSCAHAMKRFRSALLIPPIGLTSAINVRSTPSKQRTKENPETDRKNNRIWSNNRVSCAPINASEKGNDAESEHTRTFHLRSRSPARATPPCDREPTAGAAQRSMLLPFANAPGYSATRGSLHRSRHVLGSAVARLSRPERASEAPLRFCPCSYPCGS